MNAKIIQGSESNKCYRTILRLFALSRKNKKRKLKENFYETTENSKTNQNSEYTIVSLVKVFNILTFKNLSHTSILGKSSIKLNF